MEQRDKKLHHPFHPAEQGGPGVAHQVGKGGAMHAIKPAEELTFDVEQGVEGNLAGLYRRVLRSRSNAFDEFALCSHSHRTMQEAMDCQEATENMRVTTENPEAGSFDAVMTDIVAWRRRYLLSKPHRRPSVLEDSAHRIFAQLDALFGDTGASV